MYRNHQLVRTIRFKYPNIPSILGTLTTAIGATGTSIGTIMTVHLGNRYVILDVDVFVNGKEHLASVLGEVAKIREVRILEIRDAVLEIHKNGLIKMINTRPINSLEDVQKIYSPGVAEVCKLISDENSWKDTYTNISNNVAIVTDGTNVLELGNIGAWAAMPVMEAKAALFQKLVGISGTPILLNNSDLDRMIETIKSIAPTFGGIQLSGISSPRCFSILSALEKELKMPVMHDDQQGNAVVALAALINASDLCGLTLEKAKIGIIGLGTVGTAIGKFVLQFTGTPTFGTTKSEISAQRFVDSGGILSSFQQIMEICDIVIATTSQGGLIKPEMIKKGQVIFALSQPNPEITPELAMNAGAAFAINSKAINNLLSCPGIWRGTLDAMAPTINFEMFKAAAFAIADSATEEEIVPTSLNEELHLKVAHFVARAALESGIAKRKLDADYFDSNNIKEPPWL